MDDFWGCRHALCQYGKKHGTYDGLEEISLDKVGVRVENHYFMYGDYVITVEESIREADSARSFSAWISEDSYSEVRQYVIGYRPLSGMDSAGHDYRQFIRDSVLQDNNIPRAIRKLHTKLRRMNEETWENDSREDAVYRLYTAIRDVNGEVLGSFPHPRHLLTVLGFDLPQNGHVHPLALAGTSPSPSSLPIRPFRVPSA